ncbi:MAG: hypothetical protein JO269_11220 [Burkholderiaceae bacterium]|nr:hypothetical protein [Burkholderiaceae bacterium]
MHIIHLAHIRRLAGVAAEQQSGPLANPYPEGSAAHAAWLDAYYDFMAEHSMERAA